MCGPNCKPLHTHCRASHERCSKHCNSPCASKRQAAPCCLPTCCRALAMLLASALAPLASPPEIYDPVFTSADVAVLKQCGMRVRSHSTGLANPLPGCWMGAWCLGRACWLPTAWALVGRSMALGYCKSLVSPPPNPVPPLPGARSQ
jgi:hypothetical protein